MLFSVGIHAFGFDTDAGHQLFHHVVGDVAFMEDALDGSCVDGVGQHVIRDDPGYRCSYSGDFLTRKRIPTHAILAVKRRRQKAALSLLGRLPHRSACWCYRPRYLRL